MSINAAYPQDSFSTVPILGKGGIQGIVKDNEGTPLTGVAVLLKGTNKGTITDEKGFYEFKNVNEGSYIIVVQAVNIKIIEQNITVSPNEITTLDFKIEENIKQLSEVAVVAYQSPNEQPIEVGKIQIKSMDLPQSIAIIDRKILDNQLAVRMSDVLVNTNGIYIMGTTGGYQEEIAGRGFSLSSSNTFKNGVRYFNGMVSELSSVERVEVMKGSAAILFGNVAAGGIINLVTKKPKFDFGGEIDLRVGSFGFIKPSFDIYGGIDKHKKIAYRINGSYEKANSFRVGVSSERFYVNPSFLVKLGKKTELLLEADYLNDVRTPDFGAGIINYQIVELPRERFVGVSWSYFKSQQASSTFTLTHQFNKNWKISAVGAYRYYKTDLFSNTRPNTGVPINQEGMWIRNLQRSEVNDDYYIGQVDLTGNFNFGKITNQFLLGADMEKFDTQTTNYTQLSRYDTINIFGIKQYKVRTDIPNLNPSTITNAPINRVGIYAQDLIGLNKYVKLLLGIRYTYQQTESNVYTYSTNLTTQTLNFDGAFTPRLGLIIQPTENHSIFASYANSFTLNTGVDVNGKALPPSLIDQVELGIKNKLLKDALSLNVTVYQITNSNLTQTSLANGNTNSNIKELAGEVRSKGVELDLVARPFASLFVSAGYSFNETRYTKSNTYIEGSLLRYNPNHTANMSVMYKFIKGNLKGLQFGVTGLYFGKRFAGRSALVNPNSTNSNYNLIELNEYTQIDITAAYSFKQFTIRAKLGNVGDVTNYNVHDDNSLNPITPRNYQVNFCYKF